MDKRDSLTMLPFQEIEITTKNNLVFPIHLERVSSDHFECRLADAIERSAEGATAYIAFHNLISKIGVQLKELYDSDSIFVVNNPWSTEFITVPEQKQILGQGVVVKVNGDEV